MAALVFGPDRAARGSGRGTALVLGAGGVLGAAWMTGALACLAGRLPCPAGDADLIVGTSAGSVLAAALRCRVSLEEMLAWQRGQATGIFTESAALAAQDGPLPPLPRWRLGSPPLAAAGLFMPHRVPPWVAASAWLPHGRGRHAALRSLIGALQQRHQQQQHQQQSHQQQDQQQQHQQGGHQQAGSRGLGWAEGRTWIATVDYDTGQHVLFGQDGAPPAALPEAVVASCSIPGWYEPAVIGGRRYVDGGVRSTTSLSALRGTDASDIYVLAPMASTETDLPLQPHLRMERRVRQVITRAVVRQARDLAREGKRVTLLTPGPRDLAVMGINLMDLRRREGVLELSLRTTADALGDLGTPAAQAA